MRHWLIRLGPALLVMGLIFTASSTSDSDIPDFGALNFIAMKGGHLTGYAMLGAAYLHALSWQRAYSRSRILAAGILVILYAVSDEWHQSFTPGRHPSLPDVCIDTAGGILGMACLYIVRQRWISMKSRK